MPSLRGHRVALTFMYIRCPLPDFCPLMDQHFAAVQKTIKSAGAGRRAAGLGELRSGVRHARRPCRSTRRRSARTRAAGISSPASRRRCSRYATASASRRTRRAGAIEITHNLRTAVIDPEGRLVKVHSGNKWTPAELVADLKAAPAPAH